MIDLKKYSELKEKNAVEILKTENSSALSYSKYNDSTGTRLPNEVIGFDMKELEDKKKELQDEIAEIDAFIIDCKAIADYKAIA